MSRYGWFRTTPSVATRRAQARRSLAELRARDPDVQPVLLGGGRTIARSVWGRAWCDHLESLSDIANRLGRGRSYVRHDGVLDLRIRPGEVRAQVQGTRVYQVTLAVAPLPPGRWSQLVDACAGHVDSLLDLLAGRLSEGVLAVLCDRRDGLLPQAAELSSSCTCPDYARVCKHVAAVYYGVAHRLDTRPELLFTLRQVDADALVAAAHPITAPVAAELDGTDLGELFGIDLDLGPTEPPPPPPVVPAPVPEAVVRSLHPHDRPAPRPGPLPEAVTTALLAALYGAHDLSEAQATLARMPPLFGGDTAAVGRSLGSLERWLAHLSIPVFTGRLERFVLEVLRSAPPRQAFSGRVAATGTSARPALPPVALEPRPCGGVTLRGRGWPVLLDLLHPTASPELAVLPAHGRTLTAALADRGTPWLVELTDAPGPLATELAQFFRDAEAIDYDDVPHAILERGPHRLRWVDWIDWLPDRAEWVGAAGVGACTVGSSGGRTGGSTLWLGSLAPTELAVLLEARDRAEALVLPARRFDPETVYAPFVALAQDLLRAHGLPTDTDQRRWRAGPGRTLRGLKALLAPP